MLPIAENKKFFKLHPAIKHYILEAIHDSSPEMFKKIIIKRGKQDQKSYLDNFGYLDLIPELIKFTYQIKRSNDKRLLKIISEIKMRKLFYSDFLVMYPWFKMLNKDALNLHRGRWQYPAGKSGLHYESIDSLVQITSERIVEVWEKIEESLYGNNKTLLPKIMKEFILNPYTGEQNASYYDMKYSSPVKIV